MNEEEDVGKELKSRLFVIGKEENIQERPKSCPKCGAGVYLAQHKGPGQKNRISCGKCGYADMRHNLSEEEKNTE